MIGYEKSGIYILHFDHPPVPSFEIHFGISGPDLTLVNRSTLELVMQVEREEKAEKRVGGAANSLLQYDR